MNDPLSPLGPDGFEAVMPVVSLMGAGVAALLFAAVAAAAVRYLRTR